MAKFCSHCGKEALDDAVICTNCGCAFTASAPATSSPSADKASGGLVVLSVLLPIVGIILWAVKRKETPNAARTYLLTAVITWAICFVLGMIMSGM